MNIRDLFQEVLSSITSNKVRSSLTILGIVIGIGSVIAMVAVGQGTQSNIESSIQSIGSNLVMVSPGAQRGVGMEVSGGRGSAKTLKQSDADAISAGVALIKSVSPELSQRYQIVAKGTNTNTQVVGATPAYLEVRKLEIDQGSFISDYQVKDASKVAVLGPGVKDDLFGENADAVGQIIKINGVQFKVIGITVAKGGSGFSSQDDMVFVPLATAQRFLANSDYVTSISVEAQDQQSMAAVQQSITDLLLARHKISDPTQADFSVMNQADIAATASSITSTLTALLASIAGISLLVGGIGIMNMMLTTVTERTREIGLRKAIGAQRKDISNQFLMEAITLTFLGGLVGVLFGWAVSWLISTLASMTTTISLFSVLLAFGVSAAIGIIFGYYPARRAAGLNPIEALRYE